MNLAYVLNKNGDPLMPCKPAKARKLLAAEKAKVVTRQPFIIKLLHSASGYRQAVIAGMDTGSKTIGCAAIANGDVVYQAEVKLRQDVSKKMQQRAMYRRTRRGRKCRYRPARWANRASMRKEDRLAPSMRSKLESHLREKKQVELILPVTRWKVETASFDIHKISNPDVKGTDYQKVDQKNYYNVRAFVLHRDNYTCQSRCKGKHSKKLHVHHVIFRSRGGTNAPGNLLTLCENCHEDLHAGKFEISQKHSKTKHATEIGIVKSQLKKHWLFVETFGYETKFKCEQILQLPKTHSNDAVAICCEEGEIVNPAVIIAHKRHVAKGDYQQTKGIRSNIRIPVQKLFGLRKHDLIKTPKCTGFVKGKRTRGYFVVVDIFGNKLGEPSVMKNTVRITARTTTLTQLMDAAIPHGTKVPCTFAAQR